MVFINGQSSDIFNCNVGIRQGENLSLLLFSLFSNDLEEFLASKSGCGITNEVKDSSTVQNDFFIYVKLFILFYADYTFIISQSADGLQHALSEFHTIVTNGNLLSTPINVFYFHDKVLESVKEYKYLGIIFSRSGSFFKAKKHLYEQAQKAIYGVIRKIRQFNLTLECQLDLFDKIVIWYFYMVLRYGVFNSRYY